MPDPVTAYLAEVQERWDAAEDAVYATLLGRAQALTSLVDVPRLLAAVEAALALAGEFNEEDGHYPDPGDPPVSRGDKIRTAITSALLGKDGT